jgi:hypothetical protein
MNSRAPAPVKPLPTREEIKALLEESRLLYLTNPTDAAVDFGLLVARRYSQGWPEETLAADSPERDVYP